MAPLKNYSLNFDKRYFIISFSRTLPQYLTLFSVNSGVEKDYSDQFLMLY